MTADEIRELPKKLAEENRRMSEDFESNLALALFTEFVAQLAEMNATFKTKRMSGT
jgi:hypothetical protein